MSEQNQIRFKLDGPTRISFTVTANGETGSIKVINNQFGLLRGRTYKIPVNTNESLDSFNIIKILGKVRETIDILNIEDGYAVVMPIIHNAQIYDGMPIGWFI